VTEDAPAKINLCLFVGPTRADGRHELVSVMESISLSDTLRLEAAEGERDEVVCDGVEDTLVTGALAAFREATGWDGAPVRITIDKRIPVAAGLGGGSADAAAALRLAERASGRERDDALLHALATQLGSDVPGQVRPGRVLATGAGERIERLPAPEPYGVLVLPSGEHLSTPAVYAEADRLGLPRSAGQLREALDAVRRDGPPAVNDLQDAARSLCPSIDEALDAARAAGARDAMVAGSGPTVLGLFDTPEQAERAAAELAGRDPAPIAARPAVVAPTRHNARP
jgi:4-diphosphocytidyl-2-C-methyl-D-erythritol kinase